MAHLTLIPRLFMLAGIGLIAGVVHSALHEPIVLTPAQPASHNAATGTSPTDTDRPIGAVGVPDTSAQPTTKPTPAQAALGLDITIPQAAGLYAQGVQFLDARHLAEYETEHVTNSWWLAAERLTGGQTPIALTLLDKNAPVVVYCGGGMCDASKNVVILLQQAGFTKCHIMTDGLPKWKEAGHPVANGKDPLGDS